jgi:transcriptional regulator with XRE-family HTH domain
VLRAARTAQGLSQEALAERADLSRPYPSLLERGLREPTLSVLIQLAHALHCAPTALVEATLAGCTSAPTAWGQFPKISASAAQNQTAAAQPPRAA